MTETPTHDPDIELVRQYHTLRGEADGRRAVLAATGLLAYVKAFGGALERAGIPDEHPEDHCLRCGGPNIVWHAPSPLWNQVMRGGDINGDEPHGGIVCPTCFAILAEQAGIARTWRLDAEWIGVELATVTPSGRVWNPRTWLWEDPPGGAAEANQDSDGETTACPCDQFCPDGERCDGLTTQEAVAQLNAEQRADEADDLGQASTKPAEKPCPKCGLISEHTPQECDERAAQFRSAVAGTIRDMSRLSASQSHVVTSGTSGPMAPMAPGSVVITSQQPPNPALVAAINDEIASQVRRRPGYGHTAA